VLNDSLLKEEWMYRYRHVNSQALGNNYGRNMRTQKTNKEKIVWLLFTNMLNHVTHLYMLHLHINSIADILDCLGIEDLGAWSSQ